MADDLQGKKTESPQAGEPTPATNLLKLKEMKGLVAFGLSQGEGEPELTPTEAGSGFELKGYKASELRRNIEPWLTSLFQSEHLSLLVGTGLSYAVHMKATGSLPKGFENRQYAVFNDQIQTEAKRTAEASERGAPNPEDQLRTALKLREGIHVLLAAHPNTYEGLKDDYDKLIKEIDTALEELANGMLAAERGMSGKNAATDNGKAEDALRLLVSFIMSFASRTGTRDRLHIFTTNYDRLIEFGAELAGLRLLDRFIGSLAPVFRSSRLDVDYHYNPPGIRGEPRYLEGVARLTKLHGSLDWVDEGHEVRRAALPFGADDFKPYVKDAGRLLIYPNEAKDRETAEYPYVELFRDLASAACRPNSTLVTYGYGYGDDHINRIILDMLTIPSTHLVMISRDNTGDRLTNFITRSKRSSQITVLIGDHFGDLEALVDHYLPKPAIDRASIRMAELLKSRGFEGKPAPEQAADTDLGVKPEPA